VRIERRGLLHGYHAGTRRERDRPVVLQRRLPAAAEKSGIFTDDGGLGASRQRRRAERDGQRLDGFPDRHGREACRAGDRISLNHDARTLCTRNFGTAAGTHVVSPICAPSPNRKPTCRKPACNRSGIQSGGTVAGRKRVQDRPAIRLQCDDCATYRVCRVPFPAMCCPKRPQPLHVSALLWSNLTGVWSGG
jgi:hypothetical protein